MKHNFKYIFFIICIFLFNFTVNASKIFKEDCDQEKGLIFFEKIQFSFNEFETSLNSYEETRDKNCTHLWDDQFKARSIIKNRISIAFNSAKSTFEMEKSWDRRDKESISPRTIQKTVWLNAQIYSIPYLLKLVSGSHPFKQEEFDLGHETSQILEKNSEALIKIMNEEGDKEDKEEVKIYLKHEKLKNKRKEGIQSSGLKCSHSDDKDFQRHSSVQQASFKKLLESASVSEITGLPKFLTYDSIEVRRN